MVETNLYTYTAGRSSYVNMKLETLAPPTSEATTIGPLYSGIVMAWGWAIEGFNAGRDTGNFRTVREVASAAVFQC